jgi:hypothetical protein
MADTEFGNKLNSALRYGGTVAGTGFTLLAVMSLLSADQVAELKTQIEVLNNSILTAYGAVVKMWVILGPIAVMWLAKMGYDSSTIKAMAGKLLKIAANRVDPSSTDAKIAIVSAAASPSIGTLAVINPTMAAHPETPTNVVANASLATAPELAKSAAAG